MRIVLQKKYTYALHLIFATSHSILRAKQGENDVKTRKYDGMSHQRDSKMRYQYYVFALWYRASYSHVIASKPWGCKNDKTMWRTGFQLAWFCSLAPLRRECDKMLRDRNLHTIATLIEELICSFLIITIFSTIVETGELVIRLNQVTHFFVWKISRTKFCLQIR